MFLEKRLGKVIVLIKKNKKGQALVEFVLLLPVIVFVLFIVFDFASVFYKKNHLEGIIDDVVMMFENDSTINQIENYLDDNINYTYKIENNTATIKLEEAIDFVTPFADVFFKDGFKISTKRVILYE